MLFAGLKGHGVKFTARDHRTTVGRMTQDPVIIGSEVVRLIYLSKHQRKMAMSGFAVLVGMIDGLVIMARHSQDPESDVLSSPQARELLVELVETLEDGLPSIVNQLAAAMLITRERFDELLSLGEITPLELLSLLREGLARAIGEPAQTP